MSLSLLVYVTTGAMSTALCAHVYHWRLSTLSTRRSTFAAANLRLSRVRACDDFGLLAIASKPLLTAATSSQDGGRRRQQWALRGA